MHLAAIVATRQKAPFVTLADLERVPGIGPRTRDALSSWLEVPPLSSGGHTR